MTTWDILQWVLGIEALLLLEALHSDWGRVAYRRGG